MMLRTPALSQAVAALHLRPDSPYPRALARLDAESATEWGRVQAHRRAQEPVVLHTVPHPDDEPEESTV